MLVTVIVIILVVGMTVVVHYEMLSFLSKTFFVDVTNPRITVIIGLMGIIFAHLIEVWLFAGGFYLLNEASNSGKLIGSFSGSLPDYAYFSFSTYTSLGYGDIIPEGPLRLLAGMAALTGLIMIAWSASFLYIQMERYWQVKGK